MINKYTALGLISAAVLSLLSFSFIYPLLDLSNLSWPIFTSHWEGLSLVTYGKWRSLSLDHLLTDTLSGEFPVGYNFVSDYLVNILSNILGLPSVVVHSVIYPPILGFFFVFLNYYFLSKTLKLPGVALISAILIAFTADSTLLGYFFDNKDQIKTIVHVPIFTLHLATAQSLGWVLFLPTFCSFYLAFENEKILPKILAGFLIGVLLQTHTLTFINATTTITTYLICRSLFHLLSRKQYLLFVLLCTLAISCIVLFNKPKISAFDIVICCTLLSFLSVVFYPQKWKFLFATGASSIITILPYGVFVFNNLNEFSGYESGGQAIIDWTTTFVYYLPHVVLTLFLLYLLATKKEFKFDSRIIWLFSLLAATAIFTQNHAFNWHNHPYRFTVNLIFPLAIISSLAMSYGWKSRSFTIPVIAGIFFTAMVHTEIERALRDGHLRFGKPHIGNTSVSSYLSYISKNTRKDQYLLLPPEERYPNGTAFNSLVMSYSNSRGFLPDYRYIFWKKRYKNRLRSFCVIFPEFPIQDGTHKGCEDLLGDIGMDRTNESLNLLRIHDPYLKNAFLGTLNIGLLSGRYEMGNFIREQAKTLGWKIKFDNGNEIVAETNLDTQINYGKISDAHYDESGYRATITIEDTGKYVVHILGGSLNEMAEGLTIDEKHYEIHYVEPYLGEVEVKLAAGSYSFLVPWPPEIASNYKNNADYINFISLAPKSIAKNVISINNNHIPSATSF